MSKGYTVEGTQAAGRVLITEIPVDKGKKAFIDKGSGAKDQFPGRSRSMHLGERPLAARLQRGDDTGLPQNAKPRAILAE